MEEGSIRAITIGAGLFMIVLVLSAIFIYVDNAKQFANTADKSINRWKDINYENIMEYDGDAEIEVKGIDVINFIRKYVMRDDIQIKIENRGLGDFENISEWRNDIGNAAESKLQKLATNVKVKMSKKKEGNIYKIDVKELNGRIFREIEKIPEVLYGDINKDGKIDRYDLELLQNYLAISNGEKNIDEFKDNMYIKDMYENSQSNYREAADIFFDGVIDNKDLESLRSKVVRYTVSYVLSNLDYSNKETDVYTGDKYVTRIFAWDDLIFALPYSIQVTMGGRKLEGSDYTYNSLNGEITINNITGNIVITAAGNENTTMENAIVKEESTEGFSVNISARSQQRYYKFIPKETGQYIFYSTGPTKGRSMDPYGYLYDANGNLLRSNDDSGVDYNFSFTYNLTAGNVYYLGIRNYNTNYGITYENVFIKRQYED